SGYLKETIDELRRRGVIAERDGVIFFETPEAAALRREQTDEGWVLVDNAGDPKYLATDIAYHRLCLEERGVGLKLNVWGANTQLDFDFELAVQQSNDNPVYYVQYAHARIASIFRTAAERGLTPEDGDVQLLVAQGERDLIRLCQKLPELLEEVAAHRGVHL